MEPVFAIVVIAGVYFVLPRLRRTKYHRRPPPVPRVRSHRLESKPFTVVGSDRSSRFDPQSAKHLPQKQVINGAAYIIDGDTIKVKKKQIRLFGIDAPELNHPYGQKAKWALHKLCKGNTVRAEITDIDAHGRTVAQCFLADGRDLSAEMVKQGLAIDWPKFSGGKYRSLETFDARKKLFLADARQKGRMQVWEKYETRQAKQ